MQRKSFLPDQADSSRVKKSQLAARSYHSFKRRKEYGHL
ncbi:hypothetical protein QY97_03375 [Bacillus thermotolerans]|nr:hypothetical protein QY97_03375 [Bacillus thermotolerans]